MAVTTVFLMLDAVLVIHRYGRPERGDRIAFVATASERRKAAHFLIDWLKTEAPLWKREETSADERWVEAGAEDGASVGRKSGSTFRLSPRYTPCVPDYRRNRFRVERSSSQSTCSTVAQTCW
jgi:hypothetical protein